MQWPSYLRFTLPRCLLKRVGWMLMLSIWGGGAVTAAPYQKQAGVAGTVTVVGSDTMAGLVALWSQHFRQIYPHVNVQMQATGSATAPTALTEGVANIGTMSRELKASEVEYFRRKFGYAPKRLTVALDAITLFTSLDNPVTGLSLQEVDAIFSMTRYCGANQNITNWQQIGDNKQKSLPMKLFGRNSVSGTYGLFKQLALCRGDFKANVNEMPSSASIIQSVAFSPGGLGYAAFGYTYSGVKVLPIKSSGDTYIPPSSESIASGEYPLSRTLFLIINKAPQEPLPFITNEFLRFILSDEGQSLVRQGGYVSVPEVTVKRQLNLLRR
ncbi:PstS family phosphate ABC transporter substrate-binding protein [Alteromonas sp. a30]|uniref:PstS family phosphate ABC transporter substrate-binding protein n=1 Tax=Alteromonas sp. a30 TaxID=2730917 RepID=UPI0022815994|nr:phosphate ABC transporter substrate-binding protein [Alteromonas sp. a30]MCY7296045.1 phosphate ABC transporter substrate-binding protein [Alteromonas sp. a30]